MEELQEIDFNDLEKLQYLAPRASASKATVVEEQFMGSFAAVSDPAQDTMPASDGEAPQALSTMMSSFYIDTEPSAARADAGILVDKIEGSVPLGAGADEDIIVYEAPNPRKGPLVSASSSENYETPPHPSSTSIPVAFNETPSENCETLSHSVSVPAIASEIPAMPATPPSFESVSFNFSSLPSKPHHRSSLVLTIHSWNKARLVRRRQQAFKARKKTLALLAANVSEAQLHDDDDTAWSERRRNDSDIDWGDGSDDEGSNDEEGIAEGMSVDPELEHLDIRVLEDFVKRMDQDGSRFKTMDDIADEQQMEAEDLESLNQSSSDEESDDHYVDEVVNREEAMLVGDSEDGSSDDENFHDRLQRLRNASQNHNKPTSEDEPLAEMWDEYDDHEIFQVSTSTLSCI